MSKEKETKKKINLVAGVIIQIYREVDSRKKQVLRFSEDLYGFEKLMRQRLDAINMMVNKKIIADETGVEQIKQVKERLLEFIAFVNRYKGWLKKNSDLVETINEFEKQNAPKPYLEALEKGTITHKEVLERFEITLSDYEKLANEFKETSKEFSSFEAEYRDIVGKMNASVN